MGPLVKNTVRDEEKNITFHVMTPEAMTQRETFAAVHMFLAMTPRKKQPKENTTIVLQCPVGVRGMGADR